MERYGYLILDSDETYDYIHCELFSTILNCMRNVLTSLNLDRANKQKVCYIKILNNEEIVDLIRENDQEHRFGVCCLHRMTPNKKFSLYGCENILYSNILDCLEASNDFLWPSGGNFSTFNSFKHGFFKILTNKEVTNLLKIPT
ncbi:hypothetical protein AVEN_216730-1 [Araneus ventricosus]|uniref:Uncharacterized protein n=1 Tax=Araneus ventricosus TaxID=182803 RepID=A0A4Y2L131_ARAVE|nr:hypothetical protein AVEN_216730-1 [Araneus ventricosus]